MTGHKSFANIDLSKYPKVENPKLLWHSNYWDGPLSGAVEYEGKMCFFQMAEENIPGEDEKPSFYRRFVILELSPEEIEEENYWHALFREHVGTHTDYEHDPLSSGRSRAHGRVKPSSEHHKFYDPYKQREHKDYTENRVLAWFEI